VSGGKAGRTAKAIAGAVIAAVLVAAAQLPVAACCQPAEAAPLPATVEAVGTLMAAFHDYKDRHIRPDGRVVDNANGDISHSEGQGYAMLIAVKLGDRETFDRVWSWTRENLMVRDDGLIAWKWDPSASPRVVDRNNATDGDILVTWALVEAGLLWEMPSYLEAARTLALAIAGHTLERTAYGDVIMPGVEGFSAEARADGPVVNLSYWVFPAEPAMTTAAPEVDWAGVFESGLGILRDSRHGPVALPPEWSSLAGETPKPAEGFDAVFGYNAIRVPLYLAWGGNDPGLLARFAGLYDARAGTGPFVVDVASGAAVEPLEQNGFRAVAQLTDCALGAAPGGLGRVSVGPSDGLYYPDTLALLSAIAQLEMYPQCL
jgi:endoglucanase